MIDSPMAVFAAAADAIEREDWAAVAELCDPVSLIAFKRALVRSLGSANQHVLTAEEMMRHSPDMPREAAEYEVRQHEKYASQGARIRDEVAGVESVEDLAALSPKDVFIAWLAMETLPMSCTAVSTCPRKMIMRIRTSRTPNGSSFQTKRNSSSRIRAIGRRGRPAVASPPANGG